MTLEKDTRDAIGRTVRTLRELFEEDFTKQASGRFGIRSSQQTHATEPDKLDAWLDPLESLSLSPAEFAQREELVRALHYLTSEGNEPDEAVFRLIREAAFTAVNRLLAIRVAEAIGILPAVLSAGRQSPGFKEAVGDLFPSLASDENAYWTYLQVAGDELAPGVPRLFDRRHPTSAFVPSRACVDEALALLSAPELAGAWIEPETLGWGYQFFNGGDVKQMRDASAAPRNSRELAVRNQFFTPRYVVDWLVQNTLGRRLLQAGYELDLPLVIGEMGEHEPLDLEDVRVLDPAVGSGHFLLGSYDLLEQAWQSTGVSTTDAAARILPCLYGIDIDPRAAQVAQAVLLLRARRSAPTADLTPPTIVTAVALPHSKAMREEAFGGLSPAARHLADELAEALDRAPLLGSLLKVEQRLADELAEFQTVPRLTDGDADSTLADLHDALDGLVSKAASPEQRMFTAEAADALRFIQICQQRYDAVLMNPPFGAPVQGTKSYIKAAYPDAGNDIYAAFVSRGVELLNRLGRLGAITSRTGFFLRSFQDWRETLLLGHLECAADLGLGVMHEALVEAAAYVLSAEAVRERDLVVRGLLREPDKAVLALPDGGVQFSCDRRALAAVPGMPIAYWAPPAVFSAYEVHPCLEDVAYARTGLQTSDDFRFVRLWWEIDPRTIGPEARWVPFAKGGEFSPFYGEIDLVVDWENDGERIRAFPKAYVRSDEHYLQPGLTWSARTASAFHLRALPAGSIFGHRGNFIGTRKSEDLPKLLAWGNSSPVRYLLDLQLAAGETTSSGGAARDYIVGSIQTLPVPPLPDELTKPVQTLASARYHACSSSETSRHYVSPWSYGDDVDLAELLEDVGRVESAMARAFGYPPEVLSEIYREVGCPVTSYPFREDLDEQEVTALLRAPISVLVQRALQRSGGARYLAMKSYAVDRRLEILCHMFEAHPRAIIKVMRRGLDTSTLGSATILSYLLGAAFGRWDVRRAGGPPSTVDPWAAVAPTPPGALPVVGTRPRPALPDDYPLDVPADGILRDDLGHSADVISAIEQVWRTISESVSPSVSLPSRDELRTDLRLNFFGRHLAEYSGARRYAPIYWQLAVPSRRWGVWLYAPSMSRESLFAVARAAREKLTGLNEQVGLARERAETDRAARERVEGLEELTSEVEKFAAIADEVAQSGWEPDLNDGLLLNATPLEELFVNKKWRGQVAGHRKAMQKGDYPWATVQREYFEKRR